MPMTYALPASSQLVCLLPQESFYGAAEEVRSRVAPTPACSTACSVAFAQTRRQVV